MTILNMVGKSFHLLVHFQAMWRHCNTYVIHEVAYFGCDHTYQSIMMPCDWIFNYQNVCDVYAELRCLSNKTFSNCLNQLLVIFK